MYLKRKIYIYLLDWKNSKDRKPLIVKGPGKIGKTWSIKKFAKDNYKSVVEINFVTSERYITLIWILLISLLLMVVSMLFVPIHSATIQVTMMPYVVWTVLKPPLALTAAVRLTLAPM